MSVIILASDCIALHLLNLPEESVHALEILVIVDETESETDYHSYYAAPYRTAHQL